MHSCAHWFTGKYAARVTDNNSSEDIYGGHEIRKGAMKSNYRYVHTEKVAWMANINDMWLKSSYGGGGRGKP